MTKKKRKGLGALGVDALLSSTQPVALGETKTDDNLRLEQIAVGDIRPGKYQPRRQIAEDALAELANSIQSQGLIQPIVVRPKDASGFELIAGERRWRAAQIAGLTEIPAIVRDTDETAAAACALIENIQREDLNPLEEATAMQQLIARFDLTHDALAQTLGRSRAAVTNILRLLKLAPQVRDLLADHKLEMGHARALLSLDKATQPDVAMLVIQMQMTVRETEDYIAQLLSTNSKGGGKRKGNKRKLAELSAEIKQLQQELSEKIGTAVTIQHQRSGKGKLIIHYGNLDILDGVLKRVK